MTSITESRTADSANLPAGMRIQAIDMLRGLVIIIMVLDHVRDYFHASGYAFDPLDPAHTTPLLYVTRWITNFCAPTFVFLAGVSTWLQHEKGKGLKKLSRFLITRGLWLALLDSVVIGFAWAFTVPYLIVLGPFWAIGWSMVLLSACIWLPRTVVLALGIAIIVGHNLLDSIKPEQFGDLSWLWKMIHVRGAIEVNGTPVAIDGYSILPWFGVAAFGYGMGNAFLSPKRDRILRITGLIMIAAFLILRGLDGYGDPRPWTVQSDGIKTAMDFFRVLKYPPSMMYLCATLGPMLLLFPLLDRLKGRLANFLLSFGAVPLMAYISHLYIMHALAILVHIAAGHATTGMFNFFHYALFEPAPMTGTGFPLYITYIAWIIVVALVYPLCRWWGGMKRRHRTWWMSYL